MELVPSLELIVKSTRIQMRKAWCGLCLLYRLATENLKGGNSRSNPQVTKNTSFTNE